LQKAVEKKSKSSKMQSNGVPFAQVKAVKENNELKVIVRFEGCPTDQELDDYLNEVGKIYLEELPFYILYDARNVGLLTPSQIKKQVTFMRNHDQQTRRLIKRCAIVVTSSWARTALDAIFKLKPAACDLKIVQTFEDAQRYLRCGA
jgi:hypothetical protein